MDLENALKDPASEFNSPEDVVNDATLDIQQKRAILQRWRQDALLLATAESENMSGGEPNMLHRVSELLANM